MSNFPICTGKINPLLDCLRLVPPRRTSYQHKASAWEGESAGLSALSGNGEFVVILPWDFHWLPSNQLHGCFSPEPQLTSCHTNLSWLLSQYHLFPLRISLSLSLCFRFKKWGLAIFPRLTSSTWAEEILMPQAPEQLGPQVQPLQLTPLVIFQKFFSIAYHFFLI